MVLGQKNVWSAWANLASLDASKVPRSPGVYLVAAERAIPRAIGVDVHGILTIGESDSLRGRLDSFRRCARGGGAVGHMAGWRYSFLEYGKHYPVDKLKVRWKTANTKTKAYGEEGNLLLAYLAKHSELPPLNYKFNWSHYRPSDTTLRALRARLRSPGSSAVRRRA
jgi:hypothetical protein